MAKSYDQTGQEIVDSDRLDEAFDGGVNLQRLIECYIKYETEIELPEDDDFFTTFSGVTSIEIAQSSGSTTTVEIEDPFDSELSVSDAVKTYWG